MTNVLFVTSEAHPLVKTGGLGDVSASLPAALKHLGHSVILLLPAYKPVLERLGRYERVATVPLGEGDPAQIIEAVMPDTGVKLWLVEIPGCFDRDGNPYLGPDGCDWADNARRFLLFSKVVVEIALDRVGLKWKPQVVHCNDWQTGLVPALLKDEPHRPATVFTIHNLAYQGVFPRETFHALRLPDDLWSMHSLEFYGSLSFIKGGLAFADRLTTVSPTYAREILSCEMGNGLEGVLRDRADRLEGILNGIDCEVWNPATDPLIPRNYTTDSLQEKAANKSALQAMFNLPVEPLVPLVGFVGRMVEQKGVDLMLDAIPGLVQEGMQVVILGTGERRFEQSLCDIANRFPAAVGMHIGYDERRAHLVEAGADLFLMPSRFEPCGLNQMYSLRYGTVPVVRRTGGLADTVVDATPDAIANGTASGFVFEHSSQAELTDAVLRGLALFRDQVAWQRLVATGMAQEFCWERSASAYLDVYDRARADVAGRR